MTIPQSAKRSNDSGQTMVETALIIFFLVLLIFGMTEFGRAMYTRNTLNNAARGVVRSAVVTSGLQPSTTNGIACPGGTLTLTAPSSQTINLCDQYLASGFNGQSVNARVELFDSSGNPKSTAASAGDTAKVTITLPNFIFAIPRLIGPNGLIPLNISFSGTASMRQEQ